MKRANLILAGLFLCLVSHAMSAPEADCVPRIACLGDSITDGHTYPLLVQQALRAADKPVPVFLNAGIGGDTADGMVPRLERDVISRKPDRVLISVGINDFGRGVTQEDYLARVTKIIDQLTAQQIPVTLLTTTSVRHERSQQGLDVWNAALRQLAKEKNVPQADVSAAFAPRVAAGDNLWEADGCHLNFEGYRAMARGVLDGLGYSDVAVPEKQEVELMPGIVRDWQVRVAPDNNPLTNEAVAAIKPDDSWKAYTLPESDPHESWWWDQERRRGYGIRLDKYIGKSERFQAVAQVESPAERQVFLKPGGMIRAIWLNGQKIHENPTPPWHIREEVSATLKPGTNTLLIETGQVFFLSIVDQKE